MYLGELGREVGACHVAVVLVAVVHLHSREVSTHACAVSPMAVRRGHAAPPRMPAADDD